MMKLGEAANRLSRLDVLAPDGVEWALAVANRNFIGVGEPVDVVQG